MLIRTFRLIARESKECKKIHKSHPPHPSPLPANDYCYRRISCANHCESRRIFCESLLRESPDEEEKAKDGEKMNFFSLVEDSRPRAARTL